MYAIVASGELNVCMVDRHLLPSKQLKFVHFGQADLPAMQPNQGTV